MDGLRVLREAAAGLVAPAVDVVRLAHPGQPQGREGVAHAPVDGHPAGGLGRDGHRGDDVPEPVEPGVHKALERDHVA
ncbi:MAG: hypothetical protein ACK559_33840, partial [bacterium]